MPGWWDDIVMQVSWREVTSLQLAAAPELAERLLLLHRRI
jgi:hypothetical protein